MFPSNRNELKIEYTQCLYMDREYLKSNESENENEKENEK